MDPCYGGSPDICSLYLPKEWISGYCQGYAARNLPFTHGICDGEGGIWRRCGTSVSGDDSRSRGEFHNFRNQLVFGSSFFCSAVGAEKGRTEYGNTVSAFFDSGMAHRHVIRACQQNIRGKKLESTERGWRMREKNAYLTVEAALVFPMVVGVILFVVYILLFQYDRCLFEQDLGAIALWGSLAADSDVEELEAGIQGRLGALYRDKYVAWRITSLDASLHMNRFSAKGTGELSFPLPGWKIWGGSSVWSVKAAYEYCSLSPVTFIRKCHKFKNAMEREGNLHAEY